MKFLVNGIEKDLEAVDANGTEWTQDLLGNYSALHYDEELEEYMLTEEEFDWWKPVIEKLNEIAKLEKELDDDTLKEYNAQCWSSDLDNEVDEQLQWLKNRA